MGTHLVTTAHRERYIPNKVRWKQRCCGYIPGYIARKMRNVQVVKAEPVNQWQQHHHQQQQQQQTLMVQQMNQLPQQQQIVMVHANCMQVVPDMNGGVMVPLSTANAPHQNEVSYVGKYGGGTFACFDDIGSCCYSFLCLPCANGEACAWGNAFQGNGNVVTQVLVNWLLDLCFYFACHSCMAANAHVAVEKRIARKHGSYPVQNWMEHCCLHCFCSVCEQSKLHRAIKTFKQIHGPMGQPAEVEMGR